jgi:hypothetical protein
MGRVPIWEWHRSKAGGAPTPRVFWAKSSELLGNKRVEFSMNAKNDKRVRKRLKRKELSSWKAQENGKEFERKRLNG